jgi:hypothetical protein
MSTGATGTSGALTSACSLLLQENKSNPQTVKKQRFFNFILWHLGYLII